MNKNINDDYFRLKILSYFMKNDQVRLFCYKDTWNKWRNTADSDPLHSSFCPIRQHEYRINFRQWQEILSFSKRPDHIWVPPNLTINWCRGLFPGCKAAGTCSWPLTSSKCRNWESFYRANCVFLLTPPPPPTKFMCLQRKCYGIGVLTA
jgi:hypothetical protein